MQTTKQSVQHTILPDGYFDLVVELRNNRIQEIKLTGIWTIAVDVTTPADTTLLAMRFKPLATLLFPDFNFNTLLNTSVVLINNFADLDTNSLDFPDFCKHMEQYLLRQLNKQKVVDHRKIILFQEILERKNFSVQALATKSCMTSRQINRYFSTTFGLPLKTYLNIVRLRTTYKNLARQELYPANTYFDQAHYIKEIKKYTGLTPKTLSRNKNDRFLQLSTLRKITNRYKTW